MLNKELGCFVTVISHKRAHTVPDISQIIGNATWIVGNETSVPLYQHCGAEKVVFGGSLCASRNMALQMAFERGLPCVQLSDDLKKIKLAQKEGDKATARPASFAEVIRLMRDRLDKTQFKLAGVAPTPNPFYFHKPTSEQLFIVGDFILVNPCDVMFDEQMKLKEDYDYTLQHLEKFGGALRNNDVLAAFLHRTNSGGAVSVRTAALEQEMIAYLKKKWPGAIRDNPRRPNEILMKRPV